MKTFKDNLLQEKKDGLFANKIIMDVPLFIRLLEWAREDAKTDVVLHVAAENAVTCHSQGIETLSMDHYAKLVGEK